MRLNIVSHAGLVCEVLSVDGMACAPGARFQLQVWPFQLASRTGLDMNGALTIEIALFGMLR